MGRGQTRIWRIDTNFILKKNPRQSVQSVFIRVPFLLYLKNLETSLKSVNTISSKIKPKPTI